MINFRINTKVTLSSRQEEILELVAMGYSVKEMAMHLYISESTISTHILNIKALTGARKNTELSIVFFCRLKGFSIKELFTKAIFPAFIFLSLSLLQIINHQEFIRVVRGRSCSGRRVRIEQCDSMFES